MPTDTRIVAEITRNWGDDKTDLDRPLLSQQFEKVIAANLERGYALEDWQFQMVYVPSGQGAAPAIIETIVAVFVKPKPL